jgi:hypothetical protein
MVLHLILGLSNYYIDLIARVFSRATVIVFGFFALTSIFTGTHLIGLKIWKNKHAPPVVNGIPLQVLNNPDANQQPNQDDDAPRINNTQHNAEILCGKSYYIICMALVVITVLLFMTSQRWDIRKKLFLILKRLAEDWIASIITCIYLPLLLFQKRPAVKTFIYYWYNCRM